jgi:hypothetical protein
MDKLGSQEMPPGGPYLSAAEIATIYHWILEGAADN